MKTIAVSIEATKNGQTSSSRKTIHWKRRSWCRTGSTIRRKRGRNWRAVRRKRPCLRIVQPCSKPLDREPLERLRQLLREPEALKRLVKWEYLHNRTRRKRRKRRARTRSE